MLMKIPHFFWPALLLICFSLKANANIFDDEEDQNNLDQNSFNQLSSELQDLSNNKDLSQIYLPTPSSEQWGNENQIASGSGEEDSDEVKRKEAAIMRDLDEHASPISPIEGINVPMPVKEEVIENKIPKNENKEQKEIPEYKPRVRGR